jgi:hypothetical protein
VPLLREQTVADCIDASVDLVQASDRDPMLNRILAKPRIHQLSSRDHTVLSMRQSCDRLVIFQWLIASLSESAYIAG